MRRWNFGRVDEAVTPSSSAAQKTCHSWSGTEAQCSAYASPPDRNMTEQSASPSLQPRPVRNDSSMQEEQSGSTVQTEHLREEGREAVLCLQPGISRESDGLVINFEHSQLSEADWDSGEDSSWSSTSTPACKRGRHEDALTEMAVKELKQQSNIAMETKVVRKPSLHILADSCLSN